MLMDADGDGKLSLQEFQAAHERIFKAMDANKDGFVTLEEMQDFLRGGGRPTSHSSLTFDGPHEPAADHRHFAYINGAAVCAGSTA